MGLRLGGHVDHRGEVRQRKKWASDWGGMSTTGGRSASAKNGPPIGGVMRSASAKNGPPIGGYGIDASSAVAEVTRHRGIKLSRSERRPGCEADGVMRHLRFAFTLEDNFPSLPAPIRIG